MMILVTGGSASGKSAYAEQVADRLGNNDIKYYIATMQSAGEDAQRRIERHKKQREGKRFLTLEYAMEIQKCMTEEVWENGKTVLIECLSNLAANTFYDAQNSKTAGDLEESWKTIIEQIHQIAGNAENLVLVTNEIFSDGTKYEPALQNYLRLMGRLNQKLAEEADFVYEVVYGIAVKRKGKDL